MDVSLESKSLPSVGNSRKSYLQVTSQKLARDKLVHLHGRRSLALPSVGSGELKPKADFTALRNWPLAWSDRLPMAITPSFQLRIVQRLKHWISNFPSFKMTYTFLSPKQSEIEESSLESITKSGMQGVSGMKNRHLDTPSEGDRTWAVAGSRNDVARLVPLVSDPNTTSRILLRRHSTRMSHIRNSAPPTFHPDVSHPEFFSADIPSGFFNIRHLTPDGKGGHFNFLGQTYSDHLIALTRRVSQPFCTVSRQSNSEDFSSKDERLGSSSLGVKKAGYLLRAFDGKSKVKDHLGWQMLGERHKPLQVASVINFVDYSLNQGAPTGHESANTPMGMNQMAPLPGMVPLYSDITFSDCACHIEYEIAEEAMNFMSYVAEVSRGWDEPNDRDMGRMTSQPKAKVEMYI
ncbi:hypothetical protein CK203_109019 [Vitis vinifera]|uniref:Uncharacterized protein n=1 Tax=Vitis vinifera TaxID=29760 RepID=A0A438FEN9_VITVI|nr:hypothetical protein CK203_109019 [Vitis vinifera]